MTDNATPGRPSAKPRAPKERIGVKLSESEPGSGFTTLDVINGLHGVCIALDEVIVNQNYGDNAEYLAQAAKVLSTMVRDRWTS